MLFSRSRLQKPGFRQHGRGAAARRLDAPVARRAVLFQAVE